MDALLPEDLISLEGNPPNLKKPISPQIKKILDNINPTYEAMAIFQSQAYQKNWFESVFGGFIGVIIDQLTSNVLLCAEHDIDMTPSIELNTKFIRGIPAGQRMFIVVNVGNQAKPTERQLNFLKSKGVETTQDQLQFGGYNSPMHQSNVTIYDEKGRVCIVGSHLKMNNAPRGTSTSKPVIDTIVGHWDYLTDEHIDKRKDQRTEFALANFKSLREAYRVVLNRPKL
jgi:hypothetical protein